MFCFFKLFVLSSYFLSWCFLSCTRSHFGSCSCCSSAGSHTAFQHVFGSTVNSFWNFNFHDTGVVGPLIEVEWSLYTRHSDQIAYVLLITIFRSHEAKWSGCCCILVCLLCHCSMLIIGQNVEIWMVQNSLRNPDFVHYIDHYTHCLHPQSCQGQLVLENLVLVFDNKEVLEQ